MICLANFIPLLTEFGPLFGWGVQQPKYHQSLLQLEAIGGTTQRWEECTTHGPLAILDGEGSGGWYMECKTTPRCWFQISFLMLLSPSTYLGKWSKLASILFKRVGFSSPTRKRCLAAGFNFQSRRVRMASARVVWLKDVFNGWNNQMTKPWQIVCHHLTAMMVPPLLSLLWVFCFNRACMQPVGPNQPSHSTSNFILLSWALPKFFFAPGDVYLRCLSSVQELINCWHDRSSVNPGCQQDKKLSGQQKWVG